MKNCLLALAALLASNDHFIQKAIPAETTLPASWAQWLPGSPLPYEAPLTRAGMSWPYPDSLDAVVAAPQFHRVLFENERVRVLEVTVGPHQREPVHTHRWPSVLYKEQTGRGRYYDGAGHLVHESTKPYRKGPDLVRARWQEPEGPHAVENTDDVADRFIRVELKQ